MSRAATGEHAMQRIEGQAGGKWPIGNPCTPSDLCFLLRFGKLGLAAAKHSQHPDPRGSTVWRCVESVSQLSTRSFIIHEVASCSMNS